MGMKDLIVSGLISSTAVVEADGTLHLEMLDRRVPTDIYIDFTTTGQVSQPGYEGYVRVQANAVKLYEYSVFGGQYMNTFTNSTNLPFDELLSPEADEPQVFINVSHLLDV